mmetsp:Transcript_10778/g.16284  ORF Transcript_10778/g.16284 Transcript_10778/m.16284 type:complete len:628 (+) Transcript_10778:80-1963(+)|eukprot:CAMPEP_0203674808 /NCGR_PEP_ID=MMETSP0090-20130426/17427_1 /ASSEMBLY_ACC=CAM_ASM_001088 /TAXON_ID=426623 /ORGANISM="Chaetoceros affinis, Strain CCMP159" /LENGTH=627 /DNA_ID=CAMNT_0050540779 /DNA_START=72 /DNA_END=1955 /DNA_ORIENTATION=+
MTFPTPQKIKQIAAECGYEERREEVSSTIFLRKSSDGNDGNNKYPILINIFYTTRGIMTKLSHPKSGYNQLWRSTAYDSVGTLRAIFINPRAHTGRGYRSADQAQRGCARCGIQKERGEFSKNQWRKDPGQSKCSQCIQQGQQGQQGHNDRDDGHSGVSELSAAPSSSLPILFLGASEFFVTACEDVMKSESVILTVDELIQNPSKAKIADISNKYRGVVATDDWFDVDDEYKPLANKILCTLKEMYDAGGSVVVAATMGIFTVPQQLSKMFGFGSSSPWAFSCYTKKCLTTTLMGSEILGDIVPSGKRYIYTKANFIQAPEEECLFVEYIDPEDYEDDSDYDNGGPPMPEKDSPVVTHRGSSGGTLSYFGFVNDLDVSYGHIMMKLVNLSSMATGREQSRISPASKQNDDEHRGANDEDIEIDRSCIQCDADGCMKSSPSILCNKCKMVYYCSQTCQSLHYSTHMDECRLGASMRQRAASSQEIPKEVEYGRAMAAMVAGRRDFGGQLLQAEYWQFEENWEGAFEVYKSIFDQLPDRSPPEQRQVYMGISRCFYEMGRYDVAIEIGKGAIAMNRHFPGVHKYVALAQKAQGDYSGAKATMTQAVLYETPTWDDNNIKANKALLREI